ncbi:MAG: signal peptide peptidase SppA [Pseudomonadota bacterium]
MTSTADMILERRRQRRRLAFWRVIAILAILAAVLALYPWGPRQGTDHIARIDINDVIVDDFDRTAELGRIARNDRAKALIVRIASPGGTVVGSEALYEALREVAETKPVVAVIGEVAASGGYIAAIGADHIVARHNSITGSIGVISQIPDMTALLDNLGIKFSEIKSSPLKASPNPLTESPPEAFEALEVLILDSYDWFRDLVAERRSLEGEALQNVIDGRVFTGAQAETLGLIDAIGAEPSARDWLAETHEIAASLPVRDYDWRPSELPFPFDSVDGLTGGLLGVLLGGWGAGNPALASPAPRLLALYTG